MTILDGYVDEPAQFGVPPYLSPQARYLFGAARAAGLEEPGDIAYLTVDQARKDPARLGAALRTGVLVVLASCVVPGKYLRGVPITREETGRYLRGAKHHGAYTMLTGACARFGFSTGGGKPLADLRPLAAHLDAKVPDHGDAFLHDLLRAADADEAAPDDLHRRKRTPKEWDDWAVLGADLVLDHPDHPEPLTAELDTYTGCARFVDGGCRFCMEPLEGFPKYRDESRIEEEVRRLADHGVRNFRLGGQACFWSYKAKTVGKDPDPQPDVDAVRRLLEGVRRAAPDLRVLHIDNGNPSVIAKWPDESRAITRLLVEHGTDGNIAAFGLESMDPAVQAANNLNADTEVAMAATRILNEEGGHRGPSGQPWVLPGFNFISGLPGESKATHDHNLRFLERVREEGLLVRRVNIRQILPSRPGMDPMPKKGHGGFVAFKKQVRETFDRPMLERLWPAGTVLRDVYMETRDGHTTFGRPIGTYSILVGVPYEVPLESFHDVVVTDHGYRSITGFTTPFSVRGADMKMWQALPGIGKKRAATLKLDPPADAAAFATAVDDPELGARLAPHMAF